MKFLAPWVGIGAAMVVACGVYARIDAFFVEKLVPLPALPYAIAASFAAFCASMTLWAGLSHVIALACNRAKADGPKTRDNTFRIHDSTGEQIR